MRPQRKIVLKGGKENQGPYLQGTFDAQSTLLKVPDAPA